MSKNWEDKFNNWAKPPSDTEESKCKNAISAIRNAIKNSDILSSRNIDVFVQGSYRNNTNVRQDSDVDVGVSCNDVFFYELPYGYNPDSYRFATSTYSFAIFKNELEGALKNYFGSKSVTRGNKAFDIKANSYHVEADVAPFFEYRRYTAPTVFDKGVAMLPDNAPRDRIINWPEQHYRNGVEKNKDTGRRYKSIVRILKALANEMIDSRIYGGTISGFVLECLAWNVPDSYYDGESYLEDFINISHFLLSYSQTDEQCQYWLEVSSLKLLFGPQQKWTRKQVREFVITACKYIGLNK